MAKLITSFCYRLGCTGLPAVAINKATDIKKPLELEGTPARVSTSHYELS